MIDLPIDRKLQKRVAVVGAALGCLLGFMIAYIAYPMVAGTSTERTGVLEEISVAQEAPEVPEADRGTIAVLVGILGGFVGVGLSRGVARDLQRKRDLKELIKQGKK